MNLDLDEMKELEEFLKSMQATDKDVKAKKESVLDLTPKKLHQLKMLKDSNVISKKIIKDVLKHDNDGEPGDESAGRGVIKASTVLGLNTAYLFIMNSVLVDDEVRERVASLVVDLSLNLLD